MTLFTFLEFGESWLPTLLHPAEKVIERLIQIAESFLRGTLGDLIHPEKLGLFKAVQLTMQVNSSW
jgi:hypothetical protein